MSQTNAATLEAKMVAVRTSQVFSMEYRQGACPQADALIEGALAIAAAGDQNYWTRRFRVPRARRPSVG